MPITNKSAPKKKTSTDIFKGKIKEFYDILSKELDYTHKYSITKDGKNNIIHNYQCDLQVVYEYEDSYVEVVWILLDTEYDIKDEVLDLIHLSGGLLENIDENLNYEDDIVFPNLEEKLTNILNDIGYDYSVSEEYGCILDWYYNSSNFNIFYDMIKGIPLLKNPLLCNKFKLNDDYTAVFHKNKNTIDVGCQKFDINTIKELVKAYDKFQKT